MDRGVYDVVSWYEYWCVHVWDGGRVWCSEEGIIMSAGRERKMGQKRGGGRGGGGLFLQKWRNKKDRKSVGRGREGIR